MADSENSRTLPAITCRNLLWTTETVLEEHIRVKGSPRRALLGWRSWLDASRETARWNEQQQDLERQIFRLRESKVEAFAYSNRDAGAMVYAGRVDKRASLAVGDPKPGDAVTRSVGLSGVSSDNNLRTHYEDARQAELSASDVADDLAAALLGIRADTLLDVVAKLHCILSREQPSPETEEHPWPELRSVLIDLLNFVEAEGSLPTHVCLGLESEASGWTSKR